MIKTVLPMLWSILKGLVYVCLGAERFAGLQGWYWSKKLGREAYDAPVFLELARILSPGDACLDIGANVGQYSVNLSQIVGPSGKIWAFEPVPYTRAILRLVLGYCGIANVRVMSEALSDTSVSTTMVTPVDTWGVPQVGLSYICEACVSKKEVTHTIAMLPLDEVLMGNADFFVSGGFVKIDVEGHELYVLRGARSFLTRCRPVLLIEIDPDMSRRAGVDVQDTLQFLTDIGYTMGYFNLGVWYPQLTEVASGRGGEMYWFRKEPLSCRP